MSATKSKTSARTSDPPDTMRLASGRSNGNPSPPARAETSPNEPPSVRNTLSRLIDAALAGTREPDPHVIARRLLRDLPAEMLQELLFAGILERVTVHVRFARGSDIAVAETLRRTGPSKWALLQRVCVGGGWKLLEDCSAPELDTLAEQHRAIAGRNMARAAEYEQLATKVRAAGCATVGELQARLDESLAA